MKARKGAIPVPGPTMMILTDLSSGRMNDFVGDINTPISFPVMSTSSAKYSVHIPPRGLSWYVKRTIPTVNSTFPGWASREDAIEYRRGFKRSARLMNSAAE